MSTFRRALAGVSALTLMSAALVFGGTTPASAEDSSFCPEIGSTRLLTANDGQYKVWLYQTSGEAHLCFGVLTYVRGDLLFRTGLSGSLVPSVVPDVDASDCDSYLDLQDPVDFMIQWEWNSLTPPLYICIGVEGTAVGFSVTAANGSANPSPELWLDNSYVGRLYCTYVEGGSCSYPIRVL